MEDDLKRLKNREPPPKFSWKEQYKGVRDEEQGVGKRDKGWGMKDDGEGTGVKG